jgi:hypothetical protein
MPGIVTSMKMPIGAHMVGSVPAEGEMTP